MKKILLWVCGAATLIVIILSIAFVTEIMTYVFCDGDCSKDAVIYPTTVIQGLR